MTGNNEDEAAAAKKAAQQLTLFAGKLVDTPDEGFEPDTTGSTEVKSKAKSVQPKAKKTKGGEMPQVESADKSIDFENSLTELENVVRELDGEVKLEQALQLFERGIKLSVDCEKFIKSAEQKIEILKKQADGSFEAESFENESRRILAGD